jgi:hypothetical protein
VSRQCWAADHSERRRIQNAERNVFPFARVGIRLASDDLAGNFLGGQLYADVGLAGLHAVVLAVDHQRPARQRSAIMLERILDDRRPMECERPGATPVAAADAGPVRRDLERLDA